MNSPLTIGAFFSIAVLLEVYLFMLQRTALLVGRVSAIDERASREMLPWWFSVVWLIKLAKYLLAFLIFKKVGVVPAAIGLAIPFLVMRIGTYSIPPISAST